jgi:hypothetical protein
MRARSRTLPARALPLLLGLAGCTGTVEGPPPPGAAATPGAGAASPGTGGSSGVNGGSGAVAPSGGTSATTAGSGGGTAGSGVAGTAGSGVPATDPGRVTLHRLNRAEYDNTVRDLLGVTGSPAAEFPIDDRGSGFDNIADVLSLSPLHLNLLNTAAETLVATTLGDAGLRARVVSCDISQGESCARSALTAFATRAYRRPVDATELDRLMLPVTTAVAHGDSYELGLGLAMRAVLLSPHFLFRVELDPDPTSLTAHPVGAYELASRLSYFLWSSMPDETLFARAASATLSDPATLAAETTRMLADPKARALVDNFAGQWLYLRALDTLAPNREKFPEFDDELRSAMRAETELLFAEIAFGGLPANQLITADFTFLNDRLAEHYGLPAVGSDAMTRVSLAGNAERGGLLSHASFLSFTSHPQRTSPVIRGRWVMDQILCEVVPAPPPDVDVNGAETDAAMGLTQREVLERHRADPMCAGCHELMDPIGLGLENYDAIGRYRTLDGTQPIDSAGALPSGEPFTGPKELAAMVAGRPDFARCVAEKLFTYALGRAPDPTAGHHDGPTIASLASNLLTSGYSFATLVQGVVSSVPFTQRRGDPSSGVMP